MKNPARHIGFLIVLILFVFTTCLKENPDDGGSTNYRTYYIGTWMVNETWNKKLTYEVTITEDLYSSTGVYISNFANSGAGVKTHADAVSNGISIEPLPQTLSNDWVIESGSGVMNEKTKTKIDWVYIFNDGASKVYATAVYTKK